MSWRSWHLQTPPKLSPNTGRQPRSTTLRLLSPGAISWEIAPLDSAPQGLHFRVFKTVWSRLVVALKNHSDLHFPIIWLWLLAMWSVHKSFSHFNMRRFRPLCQPMNKECDPIVDPIGFLALCNEPHRTHTVWQGCRW